MHSTGIVQPPPCGVHDHGRLLAAELGRRGFEVTEEWFVDEGRRLGTTIGVSARLLRSGLGIGKGRAVIWHYASFSHSYRGLPMPGVLFGLVCRLRGGRVVTVLHELAVSWEREGWRRLLQAATQRLALPLVVAGSSVLVVTTERRAERLWARVAKPVHVVPVFSNIAVGLTPPSPPDQAAPFTVGVFGYAAPKARLELLLEALTRLGGGLGGDEVEVVLVGAPGAASPAGRRCLERAAELGVDGLLRFTGVVAPDEVSRQLLSCEVAVLLDSEGPSSRKGTLAAFLAHGRAVVALDGPQRWERLVASGAIQVVGQSPEALAQALAQLRDSPARRRQMGERAAAFYARHCDLARAGATVGRMLEGDPVEASGAG